MVLTKDEVIKALQNEVKILLHLVSKVDPAKLDYRPTAKQRSMLEVLQYLAIVGPVHLRLCMAESADMDAWRREWTAEETAAKAMDLEGVKEAIGKHPSLFDELLGPASDADLRAEVEMFNHKNSRGVWIVNIVLCHYVAYRMQLFLYLKGSGREELNTLNLWVGIDGKMGPP